MEAKTTKREYFVHLLFLLYFLILAAERIQSLARVIADGSLWSGFELYAFIAAAVALAAGLVMLGLNYNLFRAAFTLSGEAHEKIKTRFLCISAGVILVSGMIHTEYTISPLQFVAYGALIVAMIIETTIVHAAAKNKAMLWLSISYLVAFSMAIPVMYKTTIDRKALYYALEAIAVVILVIAFTYMLIRVFEHNAEDLFFVAPIIYAAALDGAIIGLGAPLNLFALIALCVTAALFVAGCIVRFVSRRDAAKQN